MKITIAENVRAFRKERKLTQEQLAEAMGVTVGTVSKWESGSSIPDITLIVELADFFETSVDVLLGYGWHGGGLGKMVERIRTLRNEKRFDEAAVETEKALQKYPNSFEVVLEGAKQYSVAGIERGSKKSFERALTLYSRSLELIGQNTNQQVSEMSIKNRIAMMYLNLGRNQEALEQMKQNNSEGINNSAIGFTLANDENRPDEALPYLSDALINGVVELMRTMYGYSVAYAHKGDGANALAALEWGRSVVAGLINPRAVSHFNMQEIQLMTGCASVAMRFGDDETALDYLRGAMRKAVAFDADPHYGFENARFYHSPKPLMAFDDFGETAVEGIHGAMSKKLDATPELIERWQALVAQVDAERAATGD